MNESTAKRRADPTRRNVVWFVTQMFMRVLFAVWFRYRVRGLENLPKDGGALLLINHQSYLDPLFVPLWMRRPVSFLARDNLFQVPLMGWILRATYVIPINRESPGKSSVRACIDRLDAGFLVGIFPEGTRSSDGAVADFRPGFLAILRRCEVPVVPVGIAGAGQALPRGAFWIRPRSIRVVFGEPILHHEFAALDDHANKPTLVQMAQQRVSACHAEAERWRQGA